MGLMQLKWMYERCTIKEYKQMEFIYGKKKAHRIIDFSYQIGKGIKEEIKEKKRLVQQV
jgi:ferritin-like protein